MPTPDELRDIAAEWLPSHTKRSDDVLAAADVWEMDRTFLRQTGERLEAAEKAWAEFKEHYPWIIQPWDDMQMTPEAVGALERLAVALAGEEK